MPAKITKIELHNDGFNQLRTSPGVMADLTARARRIASAAGEGMVAETRRGRARGRASVHTGSYAARKAQSENRALSRALDSGR